MTSIFEGDFEALKVRAKEFHDALKIVDTEDELIAIWKCWGISYLEFRPADEIEKVSAAALYRIMSREYLAKEEYMTVRKIIMEGL